MRKDDEGTRGDSLPLCYASFEFIRHIINTSNQKQKETGVVQAENLYKNGGGCSSLQINTFSDTLFSGTPPHPEEVFLLSSNGEAEDFPLEAHQTFAAEISDEERNILLEKDFEGPCLQSPKC